MFGYDKHSKAAAEKLDEYDFTELLNSCYGSDKNNLYSIIDEISQKYKDLAVVDGALDNLSNHEIMEYLSRRYNVRFVEITTYRMMPT